MDLRCDGNPPLVGLIDSWKQRGAWYFGRDGREQPRIGVQEVRGTRGEVEHSVQRKMLWEPEDHR